MKLYSPVEEPINQPDREGKDDPAPYNWILILFIVIGYIALSLMN
jgi:hypothetical protein